MSKKYDFSGWATRNNLRCSDGRVIMQDAFKSQDGQVVPLVWNHQHNEPENVLGHALLENRNEGVYAYCSFNNTDAGENAKMLVKHGDVTALSIFANKLQHNGPNVTHGAIREVSLVLAGANPGAFIDNVIEHGDTSDDSAIMFFVDENTTIKHAEEEEKEEKMDKKKTVKDVFETLSEDQKKVVYALIGMAVKDAKGGEEDMKHNAFDEEYNNNENVLSHSDMEEIFSDARRFGSLRDTVLQHGITNIDFLFPDSKNLTDKPGFINIHPSGWVKEVMGAVHHTPFSKVKMLFADITADEARARGYVKGSKKISEVLSLLKREITPTTVYKHQSLDRDDVIDITDFDVVAWMKAEMRMKLDEELARAILFGDGRTAGVDQYKIDETKIIPVYADTLNNLYAMKVTVAKGANESLPHAIVRSAVKGADNYEGSGELTWFAPNGIVSDLLLEEDALGKRLYEDVNKLALAMGVDKIVKVPASIVPEGCYGVIVDLNDYNVGADKGGSVNMFDDFDIDYNKQKYLIETRCSGGLTKPHSAIVLVAPESSVEGE